MTRRFLWRRASLWVTGSVVGAFIVALPDSGERVFSLSRTHGPSAPDLLGVAVLIGCWLPIAFLLPSLWRAAAGIPARLAAALAMLGAVGLAITIGADMGWLWLVAAAALVAAQLVLIAQRGRIAGQPSPTRE